MHTDRKIGFAMGILLIGIVAALFFRNEPLVDTRIPTVRRERELNERLRERDVAVYLNDDKNPAPEVPESTDEPAWTLRDVLKNMDSRNKAMPSPIGASRKSPKPDQSSGKETSRGGFRVVKDGPDESDKQNDKLFVQPLTDVSNSEPGKLPPLFPVENSDPVETAAAKATKAPDERPPDEIVFQVPEEFDEYVVKYGDTLSGISQKFLGSHARYREIYDANRDRMESPDRLDVGKPLRIPRVKVGAFGSQATH